MKILLSIKRNGAPAKATAKATQAKCKHRFLRTSLVLQAPHEVLPAADLSPVIPAQAGMTKIGMLSLSQCHSPQTRLATLAVAGQVACLATPPQTTAMPRAPR